MTDSQSTDSKIYSVPRQFDLTTMFVMLLVFAVLFAVMRALNTPPAAAGIVALFIGWVGAAQAILFRGKQPRLASVVAGLAFIILFAVVPILWSLANRGPFRPITSFRIFSTLFFGVFGGVVSGYFGGVLIGGVFLVADSLRRKFRHG